VTRRESGSALPTMAELRENIYASTRRVPYNKHVGVVIDPPSESEPVRVSLPPRPEITGPDGRHSMAAVYALGDICASLEVCEEIAPRALELEMGAIFFTVNTRFRALAPAGGTLTARARVIEGLGVGVGSRGETRKATIETAVEVHGEEGALVGEQRFGSYIRFMDLARIREMAPASSELVRIVES
jgi:acyl-coenzyme A thioesterase PaaI-like protein